ncbi:MAG: Mur ligase family protein, partial [Clostridia bacterium]
PTVHIGGELAALGGSTLLGDRDVFIAEACEFAGSFLKLKPTIAVILNIDEDHLDFYKDIDAIEQAFARYVRLTPEDGWCVGWGDDPRVRRVLEQSGRKTRSYGLGFHNELRAEQISYDELGRAHFVATLFGHPLCEVSLAVPGEHNLLDALAVIAVASIRELPMQEVAEHLGRYTGAHRRFELTSVTDGVNVYQDYGHNPTEIKNALKIAKLQPHKTLWAVWQPHTYSRTKKLFSQFLDTFSDADKVLITDICASREVDPGDIASEMLIAPLHEHGVDAVLTPSFDDTERYLRAHWQPGDLVITLGCGNIDLLNDQIIAHGDTK